MEQKIRGKYRDRLLTKEEAEHYSKLRRFVEEEFLPNTPSALGSSGILTEELRHAIRDSGRSHTEIANQAGISPRMIERFIMGERSIPLEVADRLAAALGLHLTAK